VATMIGCLPTQLSLAFLVVYVYTTYATQAIAFEWKPGFTVLCLGKPNLLLIGAVMLVLFSVNCM